MTVEQCNNCELVERENIKLRQMILNYMNQIKIMDGVQGKVVETIAKAAGIKIDIKKCPLPGEKKYKIEKGRDRVKELENKISEMMSLVDESTAIKMQGILDK